MEEIANPFTYPPSQYRLYTKRNLVLLQLLRSRSATKLHDQVPLEEQRTWLADQGEPPVEWDLTLLEPPRLDWIEQDGGHETFGDLWPFPDRQPTLEEHGIQQLYPKVPDHRPALRNLLKTILATYDQLLGALLIPPSHDPSNQQPPEYLQHVEWLRLNAINMIAAVNELRPVQARATLEMAMVKQLNSRREATKAIHATCDELEAQLATLQQQAAEKTGSSAQGTAMGDDGSHSNVPRQPPGLVSDEELASWANEVTF